MNDWEHMRQRAERIKEMYPAGTRLLLISMGSDPQPIEENTGGTVIGVDDIGTIMMKWDNGRSLAIIPGEDTFRKLTQDEILEENISEDEITENHGMKME